ncbi:hypothetical protein NLB33_04125 [Mycolicibacterium smegmatis]|uniref:hypothetical protein n=1 Tax=Mycolicibacterium smegmatis TaxID=1772 RepID=UPI0020A296C9|nr:hypothetical protein [Mycolicibacterium smegmatis]MCP2622039.1 hypothetical protein [Mycolicibacterium smegmatis]
MARLPSYITRVDTGDGPRYEVRLRARRADGSRFQHKKRFKTPAEATEWYSKITAELASGTHTPPSDLTVREAVEAWLSAEVGAGEADDGRCVHRSPATGGRPLRRREGAGHHQA